MDVVVVGNRKNKILPELAKRGFRIVESEPEFVVSFGGDGTLMKAEELYPGVPKIMLRDSTICKKCSVESNDVVLDKVAAGAFRIDSMMKLEAHTGNHRIAGLNDIIIHNKDPRRAMRYHIVINSKQTHHEIIGDGIVVATPFGATGYYRSITHSYFDTGIGLAFNNSIEPSDHIILNEQSVIELEVTRGPALVYADNNEMMIDIDTGDRVIVQKSADTARIVSIQ